MLCCYAFFSFAYGFAMYAPSDDIHCQLTMADLFSNNLVVIEN